MSALRVSEHCKRQLRGIVQKSPDCKLVRRVQVLLWLADGVSKTEMARLANSATASAERARSDGAAAQRRRQRVVPRDAPPATATAIRAGAGAQLCGSMAAGACAASAMSSVRIIRAGLVGILAQRFVEIHCRAGD